MIDQIRDGALGLYAELEPERHELLSDRLAVFGARDTLARLGPCPARTGPCSLIGPRRRLGVNR